MTDPPERDEIESAEDWLKGAFDFELVTASDIEHVERREAAVERRAYGLGLKDGIDVGQRRFTEQDVRDFWMFSEDHICDRCRELQEEPLEEMSKHVVEAFLASRRFTEQEVREAIRMVIDGSSIFADSPDEVERDTDEYLNDFLASRAGEGE